MAAQSFPSSLCAGRVFRFLREIVFSHNVWFHKKNKNGITMCGPHQTSGYSCVRKYNFYSARDFIIIFIALVQIERLRRIWEKSIEFVTSQLLTKSIPISIRHSIISITIMKITFFTVFHNVYSKYIFMSNIQLDKSFYFKYDDESRLQYN